MTIVVFYVYDYLNICLENETHRTFLDKPTTIVYNVIVTVADLLGSWDDHS